MLNDSCSHSLNIETIQFSFMTFTIVLQSTWKVRFSILSVHKAVHPLITISETKHLKSFVKGFTGQISGKLWFFAHSKSTSLRGHKLGFYMLKLLSDLWGTPKWGPPDEFLPPGVLQRAPNARFKSVFAFRPHWNVVATARIKPKLDHSISGP